MSSEIDAAREFRLVGAIADLVAEDDQSSESVAPCEVDDLVRASIDTSARRLGVDRRRFLQGAGAVAASLAAFEFAGCSSAPASSGRAAPPRGRGGRFNAPPPEDTAACQQALTGSEFIFDVHTHHVIPSGPWVDDAPETTSLVLSMLPAGCTDSSPVAVVNRTVCPCSTIFRPRPIAR